MLERAYEVTADRPLRTARLTLRPYEVTDLPFLADMFGREDVCRYLPWPPMDLEEARAKVEQRLRQARIEAEGQATVLAAVETETGRQDEGLRLHRITAGCDPRNTASLRVMERLGMRREADLVESWFVKGEWVGEIVCAMLETEWRTSAG